MSESSGQETVHSAAPAQKKSIAWLYFVETDSPCKLTCKICNRSCSTSKKSTSNLLRHMKKRHPHIYSKYASYSEGIRQLHLEDTREAQSEDEDAIQTMETQYDNAESSVEGTENIEIPTKKTSIVWRYFVQSSVPNKLKCTQCNKFCSYSQKSTTNLICHLRKVHPDINIPCTSSYSEGISQVHTQDTSHSQNEDETDVEEKKKEDALQAMETQFENDAGTSIPSNVAREQNVETQAEQIGAHQADVINNQILKLSVKNFFPYNLSENQDFKMFVSMLNPNYVFPNDKTLSDVVIVKAYQSEVQELKSTLKELKYIALTTDKWISIDDENFIALTVHYLDKDLTLQNKFLDCISFYKDSSINIPIFLQELVHKWRISEKIVAVVSENDPTIVNAIKKCQWQHIPCFACALNTMITRCLAKINDVITKVREIVDHFKSTPTAMAEFLSFQTEKCVAYVKLKRDAPNRWNSTFDMITRFLKNKDILNYQAMKDLYDELSLNDWHALENVVKLLVVFNTVTVEMCSETGVSLSKIPYMIRFMLKHVTHIIDTMPLTSKVKDMGKELKEELLHYSKIIEANDIICQSVLLDPRLKKRGFPENAFEEAYSSLLKNVISLRNEKMREAVIGQSEKQKNTKQEFYIDVWSKFRENEKYFTSEAMIGQSGKQEFYFDAWSDSRENEIQPAKDFTPDARNEVDVFLSEAYISMKDNPFTFWGDETNQNKFPILFELVKSKLCVPASSVPCYNIFSKEGNALIERRNLLSSKNLKEILFLHHNL